MFRVIMSAVLLSISLMLAPAVSPPPAEAASTIKICMPGALTGPAGVYGINHQRAALMAIEDINAKGGIQGAKLELIVRDDEADPTKAVTAVRELAEKLDCAVLIGYTSSNAGLALVRPIHELKIPFFNFGAVGTAIVENGRKPNYIFRYSPSDREQARFVVNWIATKRNIKKIGILYENTGHGEGGRADAAAHLKDKFGLAFAGQEYFNRGDTDFTPQLSRIRAAGAEALAYWAPSADAAHAVRSMDKMGWKVPFVGNWGLGAPDLPRLAGPLANGIFVPQDFLFSEQEGAKGERKREILRKYEAQYKETIVNPSPFAQTLDGMYIIAKVLSGIPDAANMSLAKLRDRFRDDLEKFDEYDGLVAHIKKPFTPDQHEAITYKQLFMTSWQDGKLVRVKE